MIVSPNPAAVPSVDDLPEGVFIYSDLADRMLGWGLWGEVWGDAIPAAELADMVAEAPVFFGLVEA